MAGNETPPRPTRSGPGQGSGPVVRRPRRAATPNHRRRRIVVGVLSAVFIFAAAVAGYGWWTYQQVDRIDLDLAEVASGEPRNYLVIGSDSRAEITRSDPNSGVMLGGDAPGGQRSDSIAVLRVDPDSERIDVLSIPRDLWVTLPDGSEQRINAAYAESTQTLIDTIDDNLGIPVHHFAEVDFTGFQQLIDSLGGVPMYFDSAGPRPQFGAADLRGGMCRSRRTAGTGLRPVPQSGVQERDRVAHGPVGRPRSDDAPATAHACLAVQGTVHGSRQRRSTQGADRCRTGIHDRRLRSGLRRHPGPRAAVLRLRPPTSPDPCPGGGAVSNRRRRRCTDSRRSWIGGSPRPVPRWCRTHGGDHHHRSAAEAERRDGVDLQRRWGRGRSTPRQLRALRRWVRNRRRGDVTR